MYDDGCFSFLASFILYANWLAPCPSWPLLVIRFPYGWTLRLYNSSSRPSNTILLLLWISICDYLSAPTHVGYDALISIQYRFSNLLLYNRGITSTPHHPTITTISTHVAERRFCGHPFIICTLISTFKNKKRNHTCNSRIQNCKNGANNNESADI